MPLKDSFLLSQDWRIAKSGKDSIFDTGLPATSSALMNEDVVEDDELYDRVSFLIPLMKVVVKLSFGITFISANLVN